MKTRNQIKNELEKITSRIGELKDLTSRLPTELSSLEAEKLKLEIELTTAQESESVSNKYINSRYKRPDKQKTA